MSRIDIPFSRPEAVELWSRLVAGWANTLNASGTRTLMDGITNYAEVAGSYESVTRMLWGLGSWLSYPNRPAQLSWRGVTYDLEELTHRALANGCDPKTLGSWHNEPVPRPDWDQRTVESGHVRQSFSHGRSKSVVDDKRKTRKLATPGGAPEPAQAAAPAQWSTRGLIGLVAANQCDRERRAQ